MRIPLINVNKSTENYGFDQTTEEILILNPQILFIWYSDVERYWSNEIPHPCAFAHKDGW